jgi:hypothetical protein
VSCPGHSTTAVDKGPDGKALWDSGVHRAPGFPFSHTFTTPGKYHYICVVHGGTAANGKNNPVTNMEGDVIVEAVAATQANGAPATTPSAAQVSPGSASATPGAVGSGGELSRTGGRNLLPWALLPLALVLGVRLGARRQQL